LEEGRKEDPEFGALERTADSTENGNKATRSSLYLYSWANPTHPFDRLSEVFQEERGRLRFRERGRFEVAIGSLKGARVDYETAEQR
jgi:hypothetical protein